MRYTMFGASGMEVSRFCLGAMTFGNQLSDEDSARVIDEAIDSGVNFIDTADSYGESERVIGESLGKSKRDRVFLATKVYRRFCRDKHVGRNSRVNIINSLDRSLGLLRTDYVDLYQLHHPDPRTPIMETLGTLDELVRQGKIRYIGVSNHYAWQMAYMLGDCKMHSLEPPISAQLNYNILDRQIERETVPFCERFNVAIMCYGPLSGGILTGKYHGPDDIPESSRAARSKQMQAYLRDETVVRVVERLRAMSEQTGMRMNQLAVLWLLAKSHATSVILGGSKPEHFSQIFEVADREMPAEMVKEIDELSLARVYTEFTNQPVRPGYPLAEQR